MEHVPNRKSILQIVLRPAQLQLRRAMSDEARPSHTLLKGLTPSRALALPPSPPVAAVLQAWSELVKAPPGPLKFAQQQQQQRDRMVFAFSHGLREALAMMSQDARLALDSSEASQGTWVATWMAT